MSYVLQNSKWFCKVSGTWYNFWRYFIFQTHEDILLKTTNSSHVFKVSLKPINSDIVLITFLANAEVYLCLMNGRVVSAAEQMKLYHNLIFQLLLRCGGSTLVTEKKISHLPRIFLFTLFAILYFFNVINVFIVNFWYFKLENLQQVSDISCLKRYFW